jgi:hypothetical protein
MAVSMNLIMMIESPLIASSTSSEASLTSKAVGDDALDPDVNDHHNANKRCLTTGSREDSQGRPSKRARLDIDRGVVRLP